jgi:hypothetical protein
MTMEIVETSHTKGDIADMTECGTAGATRIMCSVRIETHDRRAIW